MNIADMNQAERTVYIYELGRKHREQMAQQAIAKIKQKAFEERLQSEVFIGVQQANVTYYKALLALSKVEATP